MSNYPYPIDLNRQPIQIQPMPQQAQQIMPRPAVSLMPSTAPPVSQLQSQPLPPQSHHHQQMYATAAGPSPNIQGYFSSYSARIKQSQENALLLPMSYITGKKHRLGGDSDDDFEEMLEDSDDDDDSDNEDGNSGRKTRASAAAAAAAAAVEADAKSLAAMQEQQKKLPKIPHKKNLLYPQNANLLRMSEISEMLVPVRLDIDMDEVKLRDVFLWNMNGNLNNSKKHFAFILLTNQ